MTRKKFIKQLMGQYFASRNDANELAKAARQRGGSYEDAWAVFVATHAELKRKLQDALTRAILYGEDTTDEPRVAPYFPMYNPALDFEIKPLSDPPPWRYVYSFDTRTISPLAGIVCLKENPHIKQLGGGEV